MCAERISDSTSEKESIAPEPRASSFSPEDVSAILLRRGWLARVETETPREWRAWSERAAQLLGRHAENREELEALLALVFHYDVHDLLASPENHVVLSREGARIVLRELGREVLAGPEVGSDRLKEIVDRVIERTGYRGRELFHPLRLALAGQAGDGKLDRVILLLDSAAHLPFAVPVKSTRERMIEFCTALD